MRRVIAIVAVLAATLAQADAADSGASMSGMKMSAMKMSGMKMTAEPAVDASKFQATHQMPSTVTALDRKTGVIEVNSDGMALKLHFPPMTLANVKVGDKIVVQLAFAKP